METMTEAIRPELLCLVPVLYLVGMALKKASFLPDKYIPILLGIIGIGFCVVYALAVTTPHSGQDVLMLLFTAATQGVLVSGASVYCNQIYQQMTKGKDDKDNE